MSGRPDAGTNHPDAPWPRHAHVGDDRRTPCPHRAQLEYIRRAGWRARCVACLLPAGVRRRRYASTCLGRHSPTCLGRHSPARGRRPRPALRIHGHDRERVRHAIGEPGDRARGRGGRGARGTTGAGGHRVAENGRPTVVAWRGPRHGGLPVASRCSDARRRARRRGRQAEHREPRRGRRCAAASVQTDARERSANHKAVVSGCHHGNLIIDPIADGAPRGAIP